MHSRLVTVLTAMVAGAIGAALTGVAGGWAHGGSGTLVHSCVGKGGGVRITAAPAYGDPAETCDEKAGEVPIDWSVRGPAGPVGPRGPSGSAGGGTGAAAIAYVATKRLVTVAGSGPRRTVVSVRVPAGAYVAGAHATFGVPLVDGRGSGIARCSLTAGTRGIAADGGSTQYAAGRGEGDTDIVLQGALVVTATTTVSVRCDVDTSIPAGGYLAFPTLVVTRVASVDEQ